MYLKKSKKVKKQTEKKKKNSFKILTEKQTRLFTEEVCQSIKDMGRMEGKKKKKEKRITMIRSHMVSIGISQTVAGAGDMSMHIL